MAPPLNLACPEEHQSLDRVPWLSVSNQRASCTNGRKTDGGSGYKAGGGGGGRIAVLTRIDEFTGETPGTYTNYAGSVNGRIKVNGGTGYAAGTNGTFHLYIIPPAGTFLIVR